MTNDDAHAQLVRAVDEVQRELADFPPDEVAAVAARHRDQLLAEARITTYVPLLMTRRTREHFAARRPAPPTAAEPADAGLALSRTA
jgi:hypothetical protein